MLLASRTLIGLAIGADSAIATSYIAEFAPRSRHGQLSIIQQWMITVGILVSYLVALVILKVAPGSAGGLDWRLILGIGAIPALVAVALRARMPESPRWLMLHGRYADTAKAFGLLGMEVRRPSQAGRRRTRPGRSSTAAENRMDRRRQASADRRVRLLHLPADLRDQRAVLLRPDATGQLFQRRAPAVSTATAGVEVTAILGAVNVIATYFAFRWIDKVGRRPLAMWGYAGMAVFILVAAAGVGFLTGVPKTVLVMVGSRSSSPRSRSASAAPAG